MTQSYWDIIHDGSDAGWDSFDESRDSLRKLVLKLIQKAKKLDDYEGVLVVIEMFTTFFETHFSGMSPNQNENGEYTDCKKILFELEIALLDFFKYLDNWGEQIDRNNTINALEKVYSSWFKLFNTEQDEYGSNYSYTRQDLIMSAKIAQGKSETTLKVKEIIKTIPLSEILDSAESKSKSSQTNILFAVLLEMWINEDVQIDALYQKYLCELAESKSDVSHYFEKYFELLQMELKQKEVEKNKQNEDEKVLNCYPIKKIKPQVKAENPTKVCITGKFGINRESLIDLINNHSINYEFSKTTLKADLLVSGLESSSKVEKFEQGKIITFFDLLKLISQDK
jgi:hypothetical protein